MVAIQEGVDSDKSSQELSKDDIFEVLSNRRRRYTLHYLKQNGDAASLGDVAENVAAWENETAIESISSDERKRVYTSLQQFHLPKLDEQDVVEFDRRAGTVELADSAEEVDLYMEVIDRYDVPWSYYYLALTAVSGLFVAFSELGLPPFSSIPDLGWIAFVLVALGVSAIAHTVISRQNRLGSEGPPPELAD